MHHFELLEIAPEEFDRLTAGAWDREIHQTAPWMAFVAEAQGGRPIRAALKDSSGQTVGYFTGLTIRRLGLKILGSPFPGWTTSYMGFNLPEGFPRRVAAEALVDFAFRRLGCHHLEFMDRELTLADAEGLGFEHAMFQGFEVDLTADEETIFSRLHNARRRAIRKAHKSGVKIEEATDPGFAEEYYAQFEDVFAKQRLVPSYSIERVRSLYRHLMPTGNLLLLRARDAEGRCIASGIFPALNRTAFFWGGASWREFQILRPNELVFWHAMMYWKARGIQRLDMGGAGEYKRKYGGRDIAVPWFRRSRYAWLMPLRRRAQRAYYQYQTWKGRRKAQAAGVADDDDGSESA
jgi:hypothetical protein